MLKRTVVVVIAALFFVIPFQLHADSIPLCNDHDREVWHALIREDGACHYDHEHKDDPNQVNDIFGVPGEWWGQPGQSIAYPWMTSEMENTRKHGGFGWMVRRDLDCPSTPCLSAFRVQYHAVMSQMGMETRYHSHSGEYWIENGDGTYGLVRRGGWLDFGGLTVNYQTMIEPPMSEGLLTLRFHLEPSDFSIEYGAPAVGIWYGSPVAYAEPLGLLGRVAIRTDDSFGRYQTDGSYHFFPYARYNNSTMNIRNMELIVRPLWDTNQDGRVNLRGFTDHEGRIVSVQPWGDGQKLIDWYGIPQAPLVAPAELDMIPLVIENAPAGKVIPPYKETIVNEYDTSPEGESWIAHPN